MLNYMAKELRNVNAGEVLAMMLPTFMSELIAMGLVTEVAKGCYELTEKGVRIDPDRDL